MTKSLAAILIAAATALLGDATAAGGPQDLWIGVVSLNRPSNYDVPRGTVLDPSTVLEPVAALVGGKWWFTSLDDETAMDAIVTALYPLYSYTPVPLRGETARVRYIWSVHGRISMTTTRATGIRRWQFSSATARVVG